VSIYLIQQKNPDFSDWAHPGDTDDFIDEEWGYFTDEKEAQNFASALSATASDLITYEAVAVKEHQ
jgi:hypothetical protein